MYSYDFGKRVYIVVYFTSFIISIGNIYSIGQAEANEINESPSIISQGINTYSNIETNEELTSYEIDPTRFGAKGDGITDDSVPVQEALTLCSKNGLKCKIRRNKNFLVKNPLYIWGNANLEGEGNASSIVFNVPNVSYLVNLGISGPNILKKPFSGKISNLKFEITGGKGGRIIFFWRTIGAQIINNIFDVGAFVYSATSSGNDQSWVANGPKNCIRKNVIIKGNIIKANATNDGSEGIGLGNFDGALIESNKIIGVGDDPIGIHFSVNVKILHNDLKSVDGRIAVSNSKNVEIAYNKHERSPSGRDGKYYEGIALIYIGLETFEGNKLYAPTNIKIHHNTLIYPTGSIDLGGAIYIYGPRNVSVEYNRVINNTSGVKVAGFLLLPRRFSGHWRDPDSIDPPHVARVWDISIIGNTMEGNYPIPMRMTGNCMDYKGKVIVKNNVASDFVFYCSNISLIGNVKTKMR